MTVKRLVALIAFVFYSISISAKPTVPENARLIESHSIQKKLLFIPLKNESGNSDLDYLSYGIPILLFSNMKTNFLIEGKPIIEKRIQPSLHQHQINKQISEGKLANIFVEEGVALQTTPQTKKNETILLTASLLDFRSAELREKQKQIPAEFSVIPAKQKELQQKSPAEIAIEHNSEFYISGNIDYEPVQDPIYIDPKGNKIIITKEIRQQFQNKELPANLRKLLSEKKPKNIIVKIWLRSFNESNELYSTQMKLLAENPYENTDFKSPANQIEEALLKKNPLLLRIDSQKHPGFVFLNGAFVGKTPLEIRAPSTPLKLRLEQEGCNIHNQRLQLKQSTSLYIQCNTYQGDAGLHVASNPAGADVFLDHKNIGITPLIAQHLPPGVHRIRVSKEGYIDAFHGVELKNNQTVTIESKLTEGDTVAYYTDPGYAVQDWTYDDLSLGLFLQSLIFGGGWAYSNVRANSILDSIRSPWLPVFMPDPSYGFYQYKIIEDTRLRALKWQRTGRVMTGLGVVSLLGAGYYLYKAIDHDERPFGEIDEGISFSPTFFESSFGFSATPNHYYSESKVGFGLQWSF